MKHRHYYWPRAVFYQQTGGNWVFKVSEGGTTAYKVDIQLGRQNPDYYEVLQGLKAGDKIVTSSYENYGTMQELVLKKIIRDQQMISDSKEKLRD